MITVDQAISLVKNEAVRGPKITLPLNSALDHHLSEDVYAPIDVPSFDQSAMDGYAFKFNDIGQSLNIVGEIPAGELKSAEVDKGQAVRIFTGAMVPDSCDTVVMQELTEVSANSLTVKDAGLKMGGNIRKQGHQILKGDLALAEGTKITPAAIGFLSSLGFTEIPVYTKPKVSVLATGDELVKPGNELLKGQVYESNTFMLKAALNAEGIDPDVIHLPDDLQRTKEAIKTALTSYDMLILSGGISVGDYDFVRPALLDNGVQEIFYKVRQKPGKPLFFGKTDQKLVFALPGNPAAALSCFYIYVFRVIQAFKGGKSDDNESNAITLSSLKKKKGRAEFLKAHAANGKVEILEGQGSDVLKSFSSANCLVYLPEEKETLSKGECVTIYNLPI